MKYIDLIPTLRDVSRHYSPTDITIGYNPENDEWDYQLGDNSSSGPAYMYPVWGVGRIEENTDILELSKDLINQIDDQTDYWVSNQEMMT